MNQTKIVATAPSPSGPVTSTVVVNSAKLVEANRAGWEDLMVLVGAVIRKKGGDRDRIEWSAEELGPRLQLVTVNGERL